ncbi:MAG: hypothetical protein OXG39_05770 [Chloroflexi bacterium]|nr:hypothetical protein [Chloroflexota bacterium]
MKRYKRHDLVLVKLNKKQIEQAKQVNRQYREQITHALLCGPYGQILGSEDHCLKYYSAWLEVFPYLFAKRKKVKRAKITNYKTTFNLVNDLIAAQDALSAIYGVRPPPPQRPKQSGCCLFPFRRK